MRALYNAVEPLVNLPTRLIGDAREGRPVPHVGLPAKTAGPWRALAGPRDSNEKWPYL